MSEDRHRDLARIREALEAACEVLTRYTPGEIEHRVKSGAGDPVTEADLELDRVLRQSLLRDGEGWLSEETADDLSRLERSRVWVVDPLDGTKEFVLGLPEWCVSVGLVEDGEPVAGGILNPAAGHLVLGAVDQGVTLNGEPARFRDTSRLDGATVLASRSEVKRGEWERFAGGAFEIVPMGSVAYKLARVAAGLADATWTLVPKNEWDVAAGVALVLAAGGEAWQPDGSRPRFNRSGTRLPGLVAHAAHLRPAIERFLM
ncbi:MAG: 3'(2'),5'-bisphosphate nucleotidase CysQ [Thermoanaerobaculia bacterium]